jgi:glycerol kinase
MTRPLLLALDQGTTSTRAILFDAAGQALGVASRLLAQSYPADGWVEHDAEQIFQDSVTVMREALEAGGASAVEVTAMGITNQRETVVVWDKATGVPIHPAIV